MDAKVRLEHVAARITSRATHVLAQGQVIPTESHVFRDTETKSCAPEKKSDFPPAEQRIPRSQLQLSATAAFPQVGSGNIPKRASTLCTRVRDGSVTQSRH